MLIETRLHILAIACLDEKLKYKMFPKEADDPELKYITQRNKTKIMSSLITSSLSMGFYDVTFEVSLNFQRHFLQMSKEQLDFVGILLQHIRDDTSTMEIKLKIFR